MVGSDPLYGPECPNPTCRNTGLLVGGANSRSADWVCYRCGALFDYDDGHATPYTFHGYEPRVRKGLRNPPAKTERMDMDSTVSETRGRGRA